MSDFFPRSLANMIAGLALAVVALVGASGCSETAGPSVGPTQVNEALLLAAMPGGTVNTPTEIKELEGESVETIVAGRIDGGEIDPFQPGAVSFMISQLPDEGHGADDPDHADNCPFCKRKLANAPKAIIQFLDDTGEVLSGDAREVLSVQEGDVVYVTGTARYDAAVNTVMVTATGLFRNPRG